MRKAAGPFVVVVLTLLLVPTLFSQQAAITRYVNNTDPTCQGHSPCYSTIQVAVNAAQRGDTVRIQAGTYVEQVSIKGKNNFAGASETDRILIEADPDAPLGSVVLQGVNQLCAQGYAVQFRAQAEVEQGRFEGRVEHVVSGQASLFHSLEDLLAFFAQVLTLERR